MIDKSDNLVNNSKLITYKNWCIYKITNPVGGTYIGRTCNPRKRFSKYRRLKCVAQRLLYDSFVEFGFDNHNLTIIQSFFSNVVEANDREMFWIRSYMSNRNKYNIIGGLNLSDGGSGTIGAKRTEEQKVYQSKKMTGFKHSEESRQKILMTSKARWINKKKPVIDDAEKYKNKQISDKKKREGIINRFGKPILQYTQNGVFVKEYAYIKLAEKETGISNIKRFLSGICQSRSGFVFKYK